MPENIDDPMANVFKDTMQVIIKSKSKSNLSDKLESMLEVNIEKQMNRLDKNYTFSCNSWLNSSIHWFVWNCLGDYEFFSINCYF